MIAGPGTMTATKGDLKRLSLFGTPLAVQVLPDAEVLNAGLAEGLSERIRSASAAPGEAWRSALDLQGGAAEALTAIIQRAQALIEAMAGAPLDSSTPEVTLEVLSAGQSVAVASVPGAAWCVRYVFDDGGTSSQRHYGARFEVQDPRGVGPVMYAPHLSIADPAGPTLGISQTVGLKTGAVLVYPGWLLHGLEPYGGPQAFVSLLLNFSA